MVNKGLFSSNTDLWATPQYFFDELNKEFNFDVDVCATKENAKCKKYFTKDDDGLLQDWTQFRSIWINPPYGREIGKWVEKAFNTFNECHNVIVMLLPARTDTKWFHNFIYKKSEIRFIKGRLKFGDSKNSAPFPSMVVIFKEK